MLFNYFILDYHFVISINFTKYANYLFIIKHQLYYFLCLINLNYYYQYLIMNFN